jgi:hypothetical protein
MNVVFIRLLNFVAPGQILLPRQSQWAAGHRSGALFFARRQDYFIMTRNISFTYRDLLPFRQFIVTQNLSSTYLDWQKTWHRDADGNKPYSRPLYVRFRTNKESLMQSED